MARGIIIHIDKTYQNGVQVTFQFSCSKWAEHHPYGSTTATEYMAEAVCRHAWVQELDLNEEELQKVTEGEFNPDTSWEALETEALERAYP